MRYDLTRLDLSDLDGALVAHLLAVGEPLHVERKRDIPAPEQLSEMIGSLANAEGGWAVLGVEDDGTVVGLKPRRTDLQDEIRDSVRKTLDPLPNFAARRQAHDGKEIGFVRVYGSEDTPHVSTHKGAVYVRMPGGKRPIESRRELDDLFERGRSSTADAEARLARATVTAAALDAAELIGERSYIEPVHGEWVLTVTPIGVDESFRDRLQTRRTADSADSVAIGLLPSRGAAAGQSYPERRTIGSGWVAWGLRVGDPVAAAVIIDPAGLVTTVSRASVGSSLLNLADVVDRTVLPLLTAGLEILTAAGAPGRCLCTLHARGFAGVMLQAAPDGHVQIEGGTKSSGPHRVSGTGGDADLRAVAERLARDVFADAGLTTFR